MLHNDGGAWTEMDSTFSKGEIRAIWGASETDVFAAVGGHSQIFHYDGESWKPMECDASNQAHYVFGIWGTSGTNVFAVGRDTVGVDQRSVIRHYDGVSWSTMYVGPGASNLNGVWGSSGSDIFVVGGQGTILHYDGANWNPMTHSLGTVTLMVCGEVLVPTFLQYARTAPSHIIMVLVGN